MSRLRACVNVVRMCIFVNVMMNVSLLLYTLLGYIYIVFIIFATHNFDVLLKNKNIVF